MAETLLIILRWCLRPHAPTPPNSAAYCRERGCSPIKWTAGPRLPKPQCSAAVDHRRPEGPPEAVPRGSAGDQAAAAGEALKEMASAKEAALPVASTDPGLPGRGRGGLTAAAGRPKTPEIFDSLAPRKPPLIPSPVTKSNNHWGGQRTPIRKQPTHRVMASGKITFALRAL